MKSDFLKEKLSMKILLKFVSSSPISLYQLNDAAIFMSATTARIQQLLPQILSSQTGTGLFNMFATDDVIKANAMSL
jgi:hypothetical protein